MCEAREQRGMAIAAACKIEKKGRLYVVPSQSGSGKYTVDGDEQSPYCSCQDHETRGCVCKHIYAVRFVMQRELFPDGTETVTESVTITQTTKRQTYSQNWPAYNAAQTTEKSTFQVLLRDLCENVEQPVQTGKGRPTLLLRDAIFSAVFKVYSTVSGRRFMTDLTDAHANGFIDKLPHYNSIFNYLENPELTPILTDLIMRAAVPFKAIETDFAIDSSGFSTSKFARWFDYKYNKIRQEHEWVKCHIAVGVTTHVVAAVEITDKNTNDSPVMPTLIDSTVENFTVKEVSADKQYASVANIEKIDSIGAVPFVAFRAGITGKAGGAFAKAFRFFAMCREDFLESYHKRSNVESAFSMIKRKFGDSVRSKTDVAVRNEVLCKILCHNICCLIAAIHELGIEPKLLAC